MARVYKQGAGRRAFTILELLVVVAILGILMGMIAGFRPKTEIAETKGIIMLISQSVDSYQSNFYVYPRSSDNGYVDDNNSLVENPGQDGLYWILTRKNMTRRDGKYVETLFEEKDNTLKDDTGSGVYFTDAWGNRLVYYSGAELVSDTSASDSPTCIPRWLRASGKISTNPDAMAGKYKAEEYYFLGSAASDLNFQWDCVGTGSRNPNDYVMLTGAGSWKTAGPSVSDPTLDDDDIFNYNLANR